MSAVQLGWYRIAPVGKGGRVVGGERIGDYRVLLCWISLWCLDVDAKDVVIEDGDEDSFCDYWEGS